MKAYFSSEFGQQQLDGTANSPVPLDIIEKVLVTGYGDQVVTSITRIGNTAHVTLTSQHGIPIKFSEMEISGCTQPEYNGVFPIIVTATNSFSYEVSGSPVTPATAAVDIHCKRVGAGWTRPHARTDTVMAVQQGSGNGYFLRFANEITKPYIQMRGFRTMSDKDIGSDQFPRQPVASSEVGFYIRNNSTTRHSTLKDWIIIADDTSFYIWINVNNQTNSAISTAASYLTIAGMSDLEPEYAGQPIVTTLFGHRESHAYNNTDWLRSQVRLNVTNGYMALSESIDGTVSVALGWFNVPHIEYNNEWSQGCGYPHPVTGGLHLTKINLFSGIYDDANYRANNTSVNRGSLKNMYATQHGRTFDHLSTFDGSGDFAGKRFLLIRTGSYSNETVFEV